jgi:rhodanese-related sulfurtransferase
VEQRRSIDDVLADARRVISRLSPNEAAVAQAAGSVIVDTREYRYRRTEGDIPGAVHVPLSVLPWRLDPEGSMRSAAIQGVEQRVILICNDGFSSSLAGEWLVRIGFRDVSDVVGGFRAWSAAGLPVVTHGARKGRTARSLAVMLVF